METDDRSVRRPRRLLTARQVAVQLNKDVSTIRRWCRKGAMESVQVGPYHLLRITPEELQKHREAEE